MQEEVMPLPVLKLSGMDYALRLLEEGHPAGLVVEKPENYSGRSFRFAKGDGFRAVKLGEAVGPFRTLMSLPPVVIHGLSAERLRELGDSRDLYVVQVTEAASLREERNGADEPEGGMHWHELDRAEGEGVALASEDSKHRHLFLIEEELELEDGSVLPARSIVITELDGEHPHKIGESGNATEPDGKHGHAVTIRLPSGEVVSLKTSEDGAHPHELMTMRSGLGGLHNHTLKIAGRELTALSPADIVALTSSEPGEIEDEDGDD